MTYLHSLAIGFGLFALCLTGCGPPGVQHVSGKVTFVGGAPQSETKIIRFEPIAGTTHPDHKKSAGGTIQPDGTYQLTTSDPDDGAYPGEYKVIFLIHKTYVGRESQIEEKFTTGATTPYTVKVEAGKKNYFEFELTKAPGY